MTKSSVRRKKPPPPPLIVSFAFQIDFARISANLRKYEGPSIDAIKLYLPEILLVEYDEHHSDEEINSWFAKENIFHIKTYPFCSFVHFYSHQGQSTISCLFNLTNCRYLDLQQSMKRISLDTIRISRISLDLYSSNYLKNYLQRREMEFQTKNDQFPLSLSDDDGDDLHDLPSDFDDDADQFVLDETIETNGDLAFLRSATENFRSSLTEVEAMRDRDDRFTIPSAVLYGDDYVFTVKHYRFAVNFLDYTQFRLEKRRNSDRLHLLTSMKKRQKYSDQIQSNAHKNHKHKKSKLQQKKKHASLRQSTDS